MLHMTQIEQLNLLEETKALLEQALENLHQYVQASGDLNTENYLLASLKDALGQGNPYNQSIQQVIEKVERQGEEEEPHDQPELEGAFA
jgi:hypothetical protein